MRNTFIVGILLCLVSLVCVGLCVFTDWNDSLFLMLALLISLAVNVLNVLRFGKKKPEEESGK